MTENSPHITHIEHTVFLRLLHFNTVPHDFYRVPTTASAHRHCGLYRVQQWMQMQFASGCRNSLVLGRDDHGVGMELRLRMKIADELACYVIKPDGTDGCCVAFAAMEYAAGENGLRLNGSIVRMVEVFLPDNLNRTVRLLYHHNRGYAVGEIVSFSNENNTN